MGRAPCCDKTKVKRGPWSPEEDIKLKEFIEKNGTGGNWIALPHKAGLKRCGKSCRLRWLNYLRPNIKHGDFSDVEDRIICTLFATIGSRWSIIAAQLPGRTDNDIKNYWNTKLKKKLLGIPPSHRKPNQQVKQEQLLFQSSLENMTAVAPTSSSPQVLFHTNTVVPHQYQMKDSSSLLMFGGYEQSCSSSDGKETELEFGGGEEMGLENYLYGGNCGDEEAPLEYDYEEIKQQVSPNSGCNSLYVEDQCVATTDISFKTQLERGMHYYY